MPKNPSTTAEMVALIRAREQAFPPERRVVDDPFAPKFLEAVGSWVGSKALRPGLAAAFKAPLVGFGGLVLSRHRLMDDQLVAETAAGATQCVILGAGYDARAYRFPPPAGPARFFEIDHPTLSSRKRDLVARVVGGVPDHVRFVAVDFMKERLDERLVAEGYDRGARTIFIWEGVTYYLSEPAVRGTLATVRALAAPGSTIVFDAWARRPGMSGAVLQAARVVAGGFARAFGEPFIYTLPSVEAAAELLRSERYEVLAIHGAQAMRDVLRSRGRMLLHVEGGYVVAAGRVGDAGATVTPARAPARP